MRQATGGLLRALDQATRHRTESEPVSDGSPYVSLRPSSINLSHYCLTGGGGGRFVPRGLLYGDVETQEGIAAALATRHPVIALTSASVRGPSQFQSGRTVSVVW